MHVPTETLSQRPTDISEAEWQVRMELAACYRLVARYGWDDLIFTHLSARVPGPEHHFLINPYGELFNEITASSLVKVDEDGQVVDADPEKRINPAGFTIHSAVHMARPEAGAVMHLHYAPGVAVSAQADGLLPLSQTAMLVHKHVAYHNYEGVALNLDERERLIHDLGDKPIMLLRNHGTLSVGRSVPEAFIWTYFLIKACEIQVQAQASDNLHWPSQAAIDTTYEQSEGLPAIAGLAWKGLIRQLDREDPSYRN
ncbi:class II aldolase/adducin family protein [Mangrovitalea sediminis]|uniref:class II aldolase/adducin family protein n=1 Tax=Mangrovitalea sediminis TaxID=1982043 RepID=UPI000BE5E640|nr:class II aldolase/adducin family protein [Mangrovitalea sediminis]